MVIEGRVSVLLLLLPNREWNREVCDREIGAEGVTGIDGAEDAGGRDDGSCVFVVAGAVCVRAMVRRCGASLVSLVLALLVLTRYVGNDLPCCLKCCTNAR